MRNFFLLTTVFFVFLAASVQSQDSLTLPGKNTNPCTAVNSIITFRFNGDSVDRKMIVDSTLFNEGWHWLPQVDYWRTLMKLPEDSAFMSEKGSRKVLDRISAKFYNSMNDSTKSRYRDSLRRAFGLSDSTRILFTTGKHFFYRFENSLPLIDTSISVFLENGVDPWYAQSILLIESPNKTQKSPAGAYGPFQLMKGVAAKYGLSVAKGKDERKDLKRSAYAASMLIKKSCIPHARRMLDTLGISYNECDLWFRLLVMHNYHAGAGNVRAALEVICPNMGGMPVIQQLWQTTAGNFLNASQNYSQVLLAAQIEFLEMMVNNSNLREAHMCVWETEIQKE
jgi:hypothetical protein